MPDQRGCRFERKAQRTANGRLERHREKWQTSETVPARAKSHWPRKQLIAQAPPMCPSENAPHGTHSRALRGRVVSEGTPPKRDELAEAEALYEERCTEANSVLYRQ